jgi:hypothetical protein
MPWQPIGASEERMKTSLETFLKGCQFFVDDTLKPKLMPILQRLGCDADRAAWRDHRIVFTLNRTLFFKDHKGSGNEGAGVVVLPISSDDSLVKALIRGLSLFLEDWNLREGIKIVVAENGRLTIRCHDEGEQRAAHYKLRTNGPPLIWKADKRCPSSN